MSYVAVCLVARSLPQALYSWHADETWHVLLQADAQTLGLLLLIQDILVAEGRDPQHPCHVVSTVRRPQTIEVNHVCFPMLTPSVKQITRQHFAAEDIWPSSRCLFCFHPTCDSEP